MDDYHAHSRYSDGGDFERMLSAAAEAGLTGLGFADHCNLTEDPRRDRLRARYERTFDLTYQRRRRAIEDLRDEFDLRIYDAVEVDYEPSIEGKIADFLDEAGFDYALGSVHYAAGRDVFPFDSFADDPQATRQSFVDTYYDRVASLVESELFEVAAHIDIVESHPDLTGLTTRKHADRLADAFERSRTIPEVNAGRVGKPNKPADFHPGGVVFETLLDRRIRFTVGSDAHRPNEFAERVPALRDRLDEYDVDPASPLDAASVNL